MKSQINTLGEKNPKIVFCFLKKKKFFSSTKQEEREKKCEPLELECQIDRKWMSTPDSWKMAVWAGVVVMWTKLKREGLDFFV